MVVYLLRDWLLEQFVAAHRFRAISR
jgi:hypothetical protein